MHWNLHHTFTAIGLPLKEKEKFVPHALLLTQAADSSCLLDEDGMITRGEANRSGVSAQESRSSVGVAAALRLCGDLAFPYVCEYESRLGACIGLASGGDTTERRRRMFSETLDRALPGVKYFDDEHKYGATSSAVSAGTSKGVFSVSGRLNEGGYRGVWIILSSGVIGVEQGSIGKRNSDE